MRGIEVQLVAHQTDLRLGRDLRPETAGTRPRYRMIGDRVEALDAGLMPRHSAPAPPGRLLNASPDLATIVVLDGEDVVVRHTDREWRVRVPAADSATLLADGRLLVTAPVVATRHWQGRTYTDKGEHRVLLVHPDGSVRHETRLGPAVNAEMTAFAHPMDGSVVLDAGLGQDGSIIFRASVAGDALVVEEVLVDVVPTAFSPSGGRLLVTPHPSFPAPTRVLSWPDLMPLHELDEATLGEGVFGDDEGFDFYAAFLSEDSVILSVAEGPPMVCTAELRPIGRVVLPAEYAATAPETLFGLAEDVFGMDVHFPNGTQAATVWRVPELA